MSYQHMKISRNSLSLCVISMAGALSLGACSDVHDRLLDVQTPDIVTPDNAQSVAGAQAFFTAGVGDFSRFIGGDRGGSSPLGLNLTGGLLADEIFSARAGTESIDNRNINPNNFPIDSWTQVGNTYTRIVRGIRLLNQFPPATGGPGQLAQLHAMEGFLLSVTAENYCNGIPLWDGLSDDNLTTTNFSTGQLYTAALAQFDSALTLAGSSNPSIRNLALVGKGRTLVDQAQTASLSANLAAAAAVVGEVPTNYSFTTTFSTLTTGVVNAIFDWMNSTKNFGASDKEGGTGLDYVSSKDPRIKVDGTKIGRGQDGTPTPLMNQYPATNSAVVVASGIEARMIQAEAQLAAGDNAGFLATLNAARTTQTGLAPLTDPGTATARQDMLFRERAFWMYTTAHRLGDMRRLIRQYGRSTELVFPTGAYFKGGTYGTDVTLVPSQQETNNPNWTGCTDKKA
jgi:hypothetical protein